MESKITSSNPDAKRLSPEDIYHHRTGVLKHLVGFDARQLNLTGWLHTHPKVEILIICGKPGIGKSTIVDQLSTDLSPRLWINKPLIVDQDVLARTKIKEFGETSATEWDEDQSREYSLFFQNKVASAYEAIQGQPKRGLVIVNMNGIANRLYDRFALQSLVKEYGTQGKGDKKDRIAVLALVGDMRIQAISIGVRGMVDRKSDEEYEKFLQDNWGIYAFFEDESLRKDSSANRGRVLKTIARRGGNEEIINIRNQEVKEILKGIFAKRENESEEKKSFDVGRITYEAQLIQRLHKLNRVTKFPALTPSREVPAELTYIAIECLYTDLQLLELINNYGLPQSHDILGLNLRSKDPVCWTVKGGRSLYLS